MKELFSKKSLLNFLFIPVLALGSFYDSRLGSENFNISLLFSLFYFFSFIFFFKKKGNSKISIFLIFILIITSVINIVNWSIWGVNDFEDYSINKYIVLNCITLPICFLVSKFKNEEDFSIFLKQISLVGLLLALLGSVQIILNGFGESRLAVFGGGPIVFSRWVGLFVLIFAINFNINRFYKIPIILICFVLIILSGSKGPFFFLLLTFFIITVKNKKLIGVVLLLFAVIRYQINNITAVLSTNPKLVRLFGLDETSNITSGTSSSGRFSLLENSILSIKENIFGYGLGNFSVYSDFKKVLGSGGYPHNFFVEIWLELGILVLIIVIFVFTKILIDIYKTVYLSTVIMSKNKKTIISIWIFYFLNSMVSGDLSDARFLIVFTAVYFAYLLRAKNESSGVIDIN
jgi:O-antigen ligase